MAHEHEYTGTMGTLLCGCERGSVPEDVYHDFEGDTYRCGNCGWQVVGYVAPEDYEA